ncbi:MAG TPA: glycosyltransferase family 4 protein, partial [Nitrososphaerales archaeon]|nr:glycosyltransferase family 4 protein [Nitrososphaerales archaeon]
MSVSVWELCGNLKKSGHDIELLVQPGIGKPEDEIIDGIMVHRSELGHKLGLDQHLGVDEKNYFGEFDFILSINNFAAHSLEDLKECRIVRQIHTVASDRSISSYVSLRTGLAEYGRMFLQRRIEIGREKSLKGVKTSCVSQYLVRRMMRLGLETKTNLSFIPNGVDISVFYPKSKETVYDLLFIGRFQKLKGLDILIEALNTLANKGESYQLGIVGSFDDGQQEYCRNIANQEIAGNLDFLGTLQHKFMAEMISSTRAVVIPSRYESFSLPALEALACGKPVIASNVGGIPELVDSAVGCLVANEDAISLARGISSSLGNDDLIKSSAEEGPRRAKSYSWKRIVDLYKEFFG